MKFLDDLLDGLEDAAEAVGAAIQASAEQRRERLAAAAALLGLEADRRGRFVGRYHGVPVERSSEDRGDDGHTDWWTVTRFALRRPLPGLLVARPMQLLDNVAASFGTRDLDLGVPDDRAWWIQAARPAHDDVRRLLTHPEVLEALRAVHADDAPWSLRGGSLEVAFRGRHTEVGDRGLARGAALVRALDAVILAPWFALGQALGGSFSPEAPTLAGHLDGVPVRVETQVEHRKLVTCVAAWLSRPLPAGTQVLHEARLRDGQAPGDPILDPMIRVGTTDLPALRARLADDAVRGPLLEVVHGFPGSVVWADSVMLRSPGFVGPCLRERVDLVVELARALDAACQAPE